MWEKIPTGFLRPYWPLSGHSHQPLTIAELCLNVPLRCGIWQWVGGRPSSQPEMEIPPWEERKHDDLAEYCWSKCHKWAEPVAVHCDCCAGPKSRCLGPQLAPSTTASATCGQVYAPESFPKTALFLPFSTTVHVVPNAISGNAAIGCHPPHHMAVKCAKETEPIDV